MTVLSGGVVGREIRQTTEGKEKCSYSHIQELDKRHLQGTGNTYTVLIDVIKMPWANAADLRDFYSCFVGEGFLGIALLF